MSSDEKKRRREKFLLDRFLNQQGIKPRSTDQRKPPDPDFVIDLDGRMVGIELTEVFIRFDKSNKPPRGERESLLQEVESITDQIVSKAREIYFEANGTPVLSNILFSQIKLDKQVGEQISKLLANKIQDMVSEKVDRWSADSDNGLQPLTEAVSSIHIYKVPKKRFAHWKVVRAGIVAKLTLEHLRDRIDHKAQKLKGYSKNKTFEEIWLLMVADRTHPSQMLHHGPDFPSESLSSPFDRTFYFCDAPDEPVIEL
jgi:hypothetical protein